MSNDSLQVEHLRHRDNPYAKIQKDVPVLQALDLYQDLQKSDNPYAFYNEMFKQVYPDLPDDDMPQGSENSDHIYFLMSHKRTDLDPEGVKDLNGVLDFQSLYIDDRGIMQDGTEVLRKQFALADALSLEYKLHFMVKGEYVPFVVKRIAEAIKEDPELEKVLGYFKTTDPKGENNDAAKKDAQGGSLPQIAIYTALGKQAVVTAVEKLQSLFSDCSDEVKKSMSIDETPRLNAKIDEWLYVANGSADIKNSYLLMKRNVADHEAHPEKYDQDIAYEYKNLESLPPDRIIFFPMTLTLADGSTFTHIMKLPRSFMEFDIPFFSNAVKKGRIVQEDGGWKQEEGEPNALIPSEFYKEEAEKYLTNPQVVSDPADTDKVIKAYELFARELWFKQAISNVQRLNKTFLPSEVRRQAELFANNEDILTPDGVFYTRNDAASILEHIKNGQKYPDDELKREIEKARKAIEESER